MASENYIVINGKKAELTEEQLRQLGIEVEKKNPFARRKYNEAYYYINTIGEVKVFYEHENYTNHGNFNASNYCTDRNLMQQRALHETLSRLLWRYSMEHDGDKIDWSNHNQTKFLIGYDYPDRRFCADTYWGTKYLGGNFFYTREIAENAIEEIIKPFMKEHPDFVW